MSFNSGMHPSEVLAENDGYQIIKQVLYHVPTVEHERLENWAIGIYLREMKTNIEKQIDLLSDEGPITHLPINFKWVNSGVVEWPRPWICRMRKSEVLGDTPIRETKIVRFDFNQPESSKIIFQEPQEMPKNIFRYHFLQYWYCFDFDAEKLFIWK
jgi:hypothetical protein